MKILCKWLASISILACSTIGMADDHSPTEDANLPFAAQIQLCNLNDGKTMADYDQMANDYFKWSEKNDVEVMFVRHTPLFTSANASNPGYDFIEYLISDHETSGSSWSKWMTTKDGQKLNARWQDIATCYVKMGVLYLRYEDHEANAQDDDRIVTMDWCTRREGVSWDQIRAKHDQIEASFPEGIENIVWAIISPNVGAADAPGEFAHINVFPDMNAFMARQKWLSHDDGWKVRDDYTSSYAACNGDSAFIEQVLHRPAQ